MILHADAKPSPPSPPGNAPEEPDADRLGKPAVVAGLWVLAAILFATDQVRFPGSDDSLVSSTLYLPAVPILAALVAAGIAGLRQRALRLAGALLLVEVVTEIVWLAIEWAGELVRFDTDRFGMLVGLVNIVVSATLVYRAARARGKSAKVVGFATLAAV